MATKPVTPWDVTTALFRSSKDGSLEAGQIVSGIMDNDKAITIGQAYAFISKWLKLKIIARHTWGHYHVTANGMAITGEPEKAKRGRPVKFTPRPEPLEVRPPQPKGTRPPCPFKKGDHVRRVKESNIHSRDARGVVEDVVGEIVYVRWNGEPARRRIYPNDAILTPAYAKYDAIEKYDPATDKSGQPTSRVLAKGKKATRRKNPVARVENPRVLPNHTEFEIFSGLPIPPIKTNSGPDHVGGKPCKYPFASLNVNDSFDVPCDAKANARIMVRRLAPAVGYFSKKLGWKFVTRTIRGDKGQPDIIRVWRVK